MMRTDFADETGNQIPVQFNEGGFVSRTVSRIRNVF
ncbi:MAG: hypothetical protein ACI9LV_000701 [Candidatus Nanohaloarchaea archaeon]|jgi:hypothetical protein